MTLHLLAIALGGALGAVSRFLLSAQVQKLLGDGFPWGTLAVNVVGCFLIGVMMYLAMERAWFTPGLRALLVTGFLGSLTTFSTFGYETLLLLDQGRTAAALGSVGLNGIVGLMAVVAGRGLAAWLS